MIRHKFELAITVALFAALLPACAAAQSDDDVSLGDFARSLRKDKAQAEQTVIDNDNLTQVMDQAENQRLNGSITFSFDQTGRNFEMTSPDGTCSLSFNAKSTALLVSPIVPLDLPQTELARLDGPATIDGDDLQVSVYNGTGWNVKEITVGLTLARRPESDEDFYGATKLLPVVAGDTNPGEKRSDVTMLLHLKGSAAPFVITVFREKLGAVLDADQEWHWAIVQAKGIPPSPLASTSEY